MLHSLFLRRRNFVLVALVVALLSSSASGQTEKSPSDVVRDFYKAMREHRFKAAWALTVYKAAATDLTPQEMDDLLPFFEAQSAPIPETIQINSEEIKGDVAQVFVQLPPTEESPQITSKPIDLIRSGGAWIIGTEPEQAKVKAAGHRYFLDAVIDLNHYNMVDVLKRLVGVQALFEQAHNGVFGDAKELLAAGLLSDDMLDPRASGYTVRITVSGDKKSYTAAAEPT